MEGDESGPEDGQAADRGRLDPVRRWLPAVREAVVVVWMLYEMVNGRLPG